MTHLAPFSNTLSAEAPEMSAPLPRLPLLPMFFAALATTNVASVVAMLLSA